MIFMKPSKKKVERETIEIQKALTEGGGKLRKYQMLILGCTSLTYLLKYECIIGFCSWIPGALGLLLRSKLYPKLLGKCGRNVSFGVNVVLRHPQKIYIGDDVVVDDCCVLDAKGQDNRGILIGNGVFLGRNTILNCKNGDIILEDRVNIGFNSMIFSASQVRVGSDYLIAAYCYLVGGTHRFDDPSIPVLNQARESRGIYLKPGGWLGAHVTVFDGVVIGQNGVIGANSAVNRDIPDFAIAAGAPVKVLKERTAVVKKTSRKVTVGIVNFNGASVLKDTIRSVQKQDYTFIEKILIADNASTDESVSMIRTEFPEVEVIELAENRGPNPARNALLRHSITDLVLLMDNDIILNPDVVRRLSDALEAHPEAGIVGTQIRYAKEPEKIQYNAATIHYAGGAITNKFPFDDPVAVGAVPAGALLIHRERAVEIGMWDEDYFYGWADGDFAFRMTISGYPCLHVAGARVFHAKEKAGLSWVRLQVRNRWWFILKTYHLRSLIVLMPAILINQLAIFFFLSIKGKAIDFIVGSLQVWKTLPLVLRKRKAVQRLKRVRDKAVLSGEPIDMLGALETSLPIRAASSVLNAFFSVYWALTKWMIK
jgi:GT2 family glycosyltransferase/acetyltransferase-like isoleucine patch superfamily enzyme